MSCLSNYWFESEAQRPRWVPYEQVQDHSSVFGSRTPHHLYVGKGQSQKPLERVTSVKKPSPLALVWPAIGWKEHSQQSDPSQRYQDHDRCRFVVCYRTQRAKKQHAVTSHPHTAYN